MKKILIFIALLGIIACSGVKKLLSALTDETSESLTAETNHNQNGTVKNPEIITIPTESQRNDSRDDNNSQNESIAPMNEGTFSKASLEELDKRVVALAMQLNEDPKTYRMLFKSVPGADIYRQVGMFITVEKTGSEFYLPDNI